MTKTGLLLCAALTVGLSGLSAPAQAQYSHGPGVVYVQGPPGYVPPRILRKQREREQKIWNKYGIPPQHLRQQYRQRPQYGYGRPDYGYGPRPYGRPDYYERPRYAPPGYGRGYERYSY